MRKWVLFVAPLWSAVYSAIFFIYLLFDISAGAQGPLSRYFRVLLTIEMLTIVLDIVLFFVYLNKIIKNTSFSKQQKYLWILLLLSPGFVYQFIGVGAFVISSGVMLVYYKKYLTGEKL